MKKILIITMLICSYVSLNAHRQYNMAKVSIKNSTGQTLTIATHEGNITIPSASYSPKTIEVQRGQSYDLSVYDKKGATLGTTSEKFTPGKYEVSAESDPESSDPNAIKLTVTKIKVK